MRLRREGSEPNPASRTLRERFVFPAFVGRRTRRLAALGEEFLRWLGPISIGRDLRQPCPPLCARIERDLSRLRLVAEREGDLEAASRQKGAQPLRPFD